ncbi:DUF1947 domain-containing protein [Candidatus Hecatella orcuttiae]|uniref:DUF1947 domain-containing protein n=1 Tax=Candidatus Hecatella orcuttiae TaxID=1935119 RepID=UPI00286820EE|nr:DUF1947 domain-containing protein [Candidatus Hecatella orcuttiae]
MKRHFIKDKEFKELLHRLQSNLKLEINLEVFQKVKAEKVESDGLTVYLLDKQPFMAETKQGLLLPTLLFHEVLKALPMLVIDQGAVPHICAGADVMRPGMVSVEGDFSEGALLSVVEEKHRKTVALALSLASSTEIRETARGKVAENLHYIGDKIWRLCQSLRAGKESLK